MPNPVAVTGQYIINNAFTALGILEQGGAPSVSDSVDALAELNDMWGAWGIDEGLIFSSVAAQFAWPAATPSVGMGVTAPPPFNQIGVPARIYDAHMILGGIRKQLKIVDLETYTAHGDLTATGLIADELHPDWFVNVGNVAGVSGCITLYVFPVPSGAIILELSVGIQAFSLWTLAGANVYVPQGYVDALKYTLAYRLLPRFGVAVQPQVAETVTQLAEKAEARIREMNAINRQLKGQQGALPGSPGTPAAPQMAPQPAGAGAVR